MACRRDMGVFESMGIEPDERTERNFVIGTRELGWQENPIGLRIEIVRPKELGDEPRIVGILFWNAQIRVVFSGGDVNSVHHIFAGHECFPFCFTAEEVVRLDDQLHAVRKEYQGLVSSRC